MKTVAVIINNCCCKHTLRKKIQGNNLYDNLKELLDYFNHIVLFSEVVTYMYNRCSYFKVDFLIENETIIK